MVAKRKSWSRREMGLAIAGCVYLLALAVFVRRDTEPKVVTVRSPRGVQSYEATSCMVGDRCVTFTDRDGNRRTVCGDSVVVSER